MASEGDIYASQDEIMKDKYASSMMEQNVGYFNVLRMQLSFDLSGERKGSSSGRKEEGSSTEGPGKNTSTIELWKPSLHRLFR